MKPLKNWDNRTWLSSKRYISQFHKFIKRKAKLNKNTEILDIGCGRANIISFLQRKYKFKKKAIGIDVLKNKNTRKNILFKKSDALKYLKKGKKFDVIIIKQTIHFFSKTKIVSLLNLAKKNLKKRLNSFFLIDCRKSFYSIFIFLCCMHFRIGDLSRFDI